VSLRVILAYQSDPGNVPVDACVIPNRRTCWVQLPDIEQAADDVTRSLTIVVTDPAVMSMLDFLRDRPGVEIREANALVELAEQWQCSLPGQLTTKAAETLRLFAVPRPPNGNALGTILQHAYNSEIFLLTRLGSSDEAELLSVLAHGHTYPDVASTIESLLTRQLSVWGKQGNRLAEDLANKTGVALWYMILSILKNYPASARQAIQDELTSIFGPRPSLVSTEVIGRLSLEPKHIPLILRLPLERALHQHLLSIPIVNYLDSISSILLIELKTLSERVSDTPGVIDLIAVKAAFAKLDASQTTPILRNLEAHWHVVNDLSFDIDEITGKNPPDRAFADLADFYVNHYLAVKAAYRHDLQGRERLFEWNENYAAWLFRNYHLLTAAHRPIFAADHLSYRLRTLLDNNKLPILWIVDGLAWSAYLRMNLIAERVGLFPLGEAKACLAPIPTITEIGMTSLISGEPPSVLFQRYPKRSNWRSAREEIFRQRYPQAKIGKANCPTHIRQTLATPAPIYLLHTLAVDRYVHDDDLDEELFGAWLDVYFEKQCHALTKAIDHPHLRERHRDLVVIVATDHGHTDLLRPEVAQLSPELKIETDLLSIDASHHCVLEVTLPKKTTDDGHILREALGRDWYLLEGDSFGLPNGPTWIVPKRQQRTRGGALRVHGRPSLEETIVPIAEFTFYRTEPLKLHLSIQGRLIKDVKGQITLRVTNYESYPVKDVLIEVSDLGITSHIPSISSETTESMLVYAQPKQSGSITTRAKIASLGGPFQWTDLPVSVEKSDTERLLGEDRVARFFDEEEL